MTYEFENVTAVPAIDNISADAEQPVAHRSMFQRGIAALTVAAAGGSLVFEQSPANEALRVNIGLDVLQNTQSSVAVGATIAAVTAGIEMGSSSLISLGLHTEGGAVQSLKNRLSKKSQVAIEQDDAGIDSKKTALSRAADKLTNVGIALGLGAGLVTVKEHMKDPEPTLGKDLKTSAKATGIVAGVSGGIGYLAAGGISHANGTIFETPAELFVDYGTDTRFWIGALAVGYGAYYAKKGAKSLFGRRKNSNEENLQTFLEANGDNAHQSGQSIFSVRPKATD